MRLFLDSNLQKSLARENFLVQVLATIALFIISFFFIFWIGSYFEVDIFPLENRSTIYTTFHTNIFDNFVDTLIITLLTLLWFCLSLRGKTRIVSAIGYGALTTSAILTNFAPLFEVAVLASIPLITSFFAYHYFSNKKIIEFQKNLLVEFFSFSILYIAFSGLIITLLTISSNFGLSGWIKNHALEIFLLFSSFSPALILFLTAGSAVKLLAINTISKLKIRTGQYQILPQKIKRKTSFLFLFLFMLLASFFALIPHQSFINDENELVGVDSVFYVKWLNNVRGDDQDNFLYQSFVVKNSEDRPLSSLIFLAVLSIFPENPSQVIDHLPIILSPILVLAIFFLTRELTSNDTISLFASFLTAISFQTLIGIYSGLYANWLSLIFAYFSIVFLFRFLKRSSKVDYLAFSIFWFLIMLSHIYTWTIIVAFASIFLIVTWRLKIFEKKKVVLVFVIIIASVAFDSGKSLMLDVNSGFERNVNIASDNMSFQHFSSFWDNLAQTSLIYAGGQFGNFLILSLCIFWLIRSNFREMPNLFIAIFLSIGFLPILFGGELILNRIFYNIPFQIPAAIGLYYLAKQPKGKLLVLAVSIWILTVSLQTITNFI